MKKLIGLSLAFLLLITGCSVVEEKSFDAIINNVLYQDQNLANKNYDGYKLYLPRGTTTNDKVSKNLVIKDQDNTYYLYVDTIAYYYKTRENHEIDNNIFYSTNLNYKDKFGYIDISKIDNKYFLEVMYNYAKIEAYVKEDSLYDAFLNICYILTTISYNDSTIKYNLDNDILETKTVEFDIFKSKKNNDNFLQWIKEYDKYENKNSSKDQDIIETEDND